VAGDGFITGVGQGFGGWSGDTVGGVRGLTLCSEFGNYSKYRSWHMATVLL